MAWDDALQIGHAAMDDDHRKLVELVNNFQNNLNAPLPFADLLQDLDQLLEFTSWHFRHEERLMNSCGYPEMIAHKKEHKELIATLYQLHSRVRDKDDGVLAELSRFIKEWLHRHIPEVDRKLGLHLQNLEKIRPQSGDL